VIDWGLAKDLRSKHERDGASPSADKNAERDAGAALRAYDDDVGDGGDAITVAGHALGTPCYMSPEQARGGEVDERADVYALGALLYHVLSGQPPFAPGTSREVLARLLAGPPAALAERARELPADLVTIVEKAMARDPAARYGSAREMAADLLRFTQGRLVGAHPYSRSTLVRRWARRYRAILAMAVALVVGVAVTAGLSVRRIVRERDRADAQRAAAEEGKRSARAHGDAAEALVEYAVVELRDQLAALGRLDVLSGLGAEVEKYYGSLSSLDDASSGAKLTRRAIGLGLLGEVAAVKHDLPTAQARELQAIRVLDQAIAATPGDPKARERRVESELRLAAVDSDLSQEGEALAMSRQAATEARALAAEAPARKSAQLLALRTARDLRTRLDGSTDPTETVEAARAVPDLLQKLVAAEPDDFDLRLQLSDSYIDLGVAQGFYGLDQDMLASEQAALRILDRLAAERPDDTRVQDQRASALQLSSGAELSGGHADAALGLARQSLALREQLVARDPSNGDWQSRLAIALACVSQSLGELGRVEEAAAVSLRELQVREATARKAPESASARAHLGRSQIELAEARRAVGDPQGALALLARAQTTFARLALSDHVNFRWLLADTYLETGRLELETKRLAAALASATKADALAQEITPSSDDEVLLLQARARGLLGEVLEARRETDARARLTEATASFDVFWERSRDRTEWVRRGAPEASRALAALLVRAGDRAGARQSLEVASARIQELEAAGRVPLSRRAQVSELRADLARLAP
jgi:hypothetical protein